MIKIIGLLSVAIVIAVVAYKNLNSKQIDASDEIGQTLHITPTNSPNTLSIEGLRRRNFTTKIERVRTVQQSKDFNSYVVSFVSDGLKEYALMNIPNGEQPERGWPVVIVNHGHIEPNIYSVEKSYINTSAYFARAGFLVLKPDYRGHDLSEGESETIASRIGYGVDVLNLLAGISSIPQADVKNVCMYGHSMGGDVSLRAMEVCDDCVKAASLWGPAVTTYPEAVMYFVKKNRGLGWEDRANKRQAELDKLYPDKNYQEISVFDHLDLVKTPIYIHHATTDESVPYSWGVELNKKLLELGKEVSFFSYPGDNHDIAKNWGTALKRDVDFFRSKIN